LVYADGTTDQESWTEDLAYPIAEASLPGVLPIPNTTLNPGERHTFTQNVRLTAGRISVTSIKPSIALLVFSDGTGLGNSKDVAMVFQGRREISQHLGALIAQVLDAESSPAPEQRYRELISVAKTRVSPTSRPASEATTKDLGPYEKRLEQYSTARGTPVFELMRNVDLTVQRVLMEMSTPIVSPPEVKKCALSENLTERAY
jgi:hypothetical protein